MHARDVRAFLPSRDFDVSKRFYCALGCPLEWEDEDLALFSLADAKFYVQRFYVKEWAENSMMLISVDDAAACHARVAALVESGLYPGIRVAEPRLEAPPYDAWVTYAWDPCGVLLHLVQWNARAGGETAEIVNTR
ncbi:hypothetical protein H9K76_07495 [Diaphorobacter ruginosibacter]|uniref:VOC family protein n=1 Tax=Diaphorobacter ruginosibacter TaxID=1715720 RepID=A0A7G9RV75_9BURK|nr:hypothetical protein H9K76_07495 [Diaphorobacter ruginosibacter]